MSVGVQALLQLYRDGHAYQEGHHWRRIDMIGHGGSGTSYCIEDIRSNIWLAMQEVIKGLSKIIKIY